MRREQVGGDEPSLIAQLRVFHDGAGLGAEALRATLLAAAERHGLVLGSSLDVERTAVRAYDPGWPPLLDEVRLCGSVVRIISQELNEGNALTVVFARGLCLILSYPFDMEEEYMRVPKSLKTSSGLYSVDVRNTHAV